MKDVPLERLTIDPEQRTRQVCTKLQLRYVDSREYIRERRARVMRERGVYAPLYRQFDYTHLDREGHRAVAEAFFDTIGLEF